MAHDARGTADHASLLELAARYTVELPDLPADIFEVAAAMNYPIASFCT